MTSSIGAVLVKVGESRLDYLKRVAKWCREQYKRQRQTESCHPSHTADEVMRDAEKRFTDLGTFGVEGWCDDCGRGGWQYLNAGDPYSLTLLFSSKSERFSVGCWGDIAERLI
jgi:hypothetical protein